jgi:hypothetical protein
MYINYLILAPNLNSYNYDIRQVERLEGPRERLEEVSLTTIAKQLK